MRKSLTIIGIILSTIILAVLSVLTALRIRSLGNRPVAPNVPESKPAAVETVPPDDAVPEVADCKKTFIVDEPPELAICEAKKSYRDDSRNRAGSYYIEEDNFIPNGETVSREEKIVFRIDFSSAGIGKSFVISDVLPTSVNYLDGDKGCTYNSANRTVTCRGLLEEDNLGRAFRVQIKANVEGGITNMATVQAGNDPESTCSNSLNVVVSPTQTPTTTPSPSETPTPPTTTTTPIPTTTSAPGSMCEYLEVDKIAGTLPLTVKFSGKGFDPIRVKGFRFHFGDGEKREFFGSFASSEIQEVEHTYQSGGRYEAYLEIMDDGDHWKTRPECKVTITVDAATSPAPVETKTVTTAAESTPTEMMLPEAGIKIPTLGGILVGFLLIAFGAALVF